MKLIICLALLCMTVFPTFSSATEAPELLLANVYERDIALADHSPSPGN